ncbi:WecB/TagA/CpsF family glycosyltransferase [Aquamicrobium sp. LC103]|uniref:WecB/TagA/CpsF family glycosyltransferase n=1 Tax=Aquamicrobium sp. LC103 TaxID=1120658 RepID=UPI00063E9144|nr:WecB/TagA/CpsF family glycosyltransferase [Aquamicrobium sp. LC103]TKT77465.1 WecB/TagA/CpsF family glycosyltransferase [Aquamicrobium sp. LC103]
MRNDGKFNVLGIGVSCVDYAGATAAIIAAAKAKRPLKVTALAVHGIMTGVMDPLHRWRLNRFDLVTPDGQPVRWAMNLLHRRGLRQRVYGPDLTIEVCRQAAREDLPVFLYGSRPEVLDELAANLAIRIPGLTICGRRPSLFRKSTPEEKLQIVQEIRDSGAAIVLVGLGCPRQEVWVHEYADILQRPALAVGAAFDFHAGLLSQAPRFLQDRGLEWLYRLMREPRRLWRRYLYLNPYFLALLAMQLAGLRRFADSGSQPGDEVGFA